MKSSPSLILGTAQLGLDYGVANREGKPDSVKATEIIAAALECGIDSFDTAQAYGDSEAVLGASLKELGACDRVKIISKFSPSLNPRDQAGLIASVKNSLENLGIPKLSCLMLHRAAWMEELDNGLRDALCEIRRLGYCDNFGVSVYSPVEAASALDNELFNTVQAPFNAWDTRMLDAGIFELAKQKNKMLHLRSVFLQGLLLMDCREAIVRVPEAEPAVTKWEEISRTTGISKKELAVGFAKTTGWPLVIGAENPKQIRENAELFAEAYLCSETYSQISESMKPFINDKIINPAKWVSA